jgi:hypothetical protein
MYALLARETPTAVVFRRGPSKQVLLLRWNTATDEFEEGQWLRGRIYERRCDLSPDGDLLIYFAASHKPPYGSWTAVSRPPSLTALALWPKGDCWGGGGHFVSRGHIALNHRDRETTLADGFSLPKRITVTPFGKHSGWGEDDPIWSLRLERDGWVHAGVARGAIVWEKRHPLAPERYTLRMAIRDIARPNGPWYRIDHSAGPHELRGTDWADWSHSGDLLFAKGLSLYRIPFANGALSAEPRQIIDLADRKFVAREPLPEARVWPR